MIVRQVQDGLFYKSWCNNIEESAIQQIENLCRLPFATSVAIMPDCHSGYGMPIGGVLATKGVIIPNAVGVDIGCGMCAVKTSLKAEQLDKETIKKIFGGSKEYQGGIRSCIPVGMNHHSKAQDERLMPNIKDVNLATKGQGICEIEYTKSLKSLGTLGGGNHFLEIQKDQDEFVWIMIHSGSRNLGKQVADNYNKIAIALNEKWYSKVPKNWQLAFLPLESEEAVAYLFEMEYCIEFALSNRKLMIIRTLDCFCKVFGENSFTVEGDLINISHNYAQMENHFGHNVMVHRKGATLARKGTIGIIPGSQGTKSYIVEGLGNKDSLESCSHGSGRKMSRTKAQNELSLEEEIKKLDEQGIVHGIRTTKDLDEASGAYKDIEEVMEAQKDLVKILVELSPIGCIKG